MKKTDETIKYYEENASAFIDSTIGADVSELYTRFEEYLSPGCRVLDLGCGSGRDSKYFVGRGYDVAAADPSSAMCAQTRAYAKVPVFEMKAEELAFSNEFDAVWACASMLHVPREKQPEAFHRIGKALNKDGICYCSWKYGDTDRFEGGRCFTDFTEKSLRELLQGISEFEVLEVWITSDVRKDRQNQKWINVLMRKG